MLQTKVEMSLQRQSLDNGRNNCVTLVDCGIEYCVNSDDDSKLDNNANSLMSPTSTGLIDEKDIRDNIEYNKPPPSPPNSIFRFTQTNSNDLVPTEKPAIRTTIAGIKSYHIISYHIISYHIISNNMIL